MFTRRSSAEKGFPDGAVVKKKQETQGQSLGWEDPLEKETATHSSILAREIPWMEEPGGHSPWETQLSN